MRNTLLAVVAVIELIGNLPYIINTLRGKSKPNLASWSTWTLLNVITLVSALAAGGALNTVVLAGTFLIGSSTILIISLFKGIKKYTLFDGICQTISLVGVVLWQVSHDPNMALACVVLVDCFAIMPTIRHAYVQPHEETWVTYAISGLAAIALTALATSHSFAALSITVESALINACLVFILLYRGTKLSAKALVR